MVTASVHQTSANETEKLNSEKFPLKNRSLHLSAEIRENQVLACLLDKYINQYIAWASYLLSGKNSSLEKILEDEMMNTPAASISVTFTANSFVLVPALYFKKEEAHNYLHSQLLNKADEITCYDYIKNLDSYNIYTVNPNLALFRSKYPNAIFRHHSSIFIENILTENKNSQDTQVYVYVFTAYIDVMVLHTGKLILANRYYYKTTGDFMYHLLWVYEQLQLNADKTPCIFYGEIHKESEIYLLAVRYIKKVKPGESATLPSFAPELNSLPVYTHYSLFAQYLCV